MKNPPQPRFLTQLWASRYYPADKDYRSHWRLIQPLIFESRLAGVIEVPTGFLTDFASVPRLPLLFLLFGDTAHASAVIHDYLCRVRYRQCKIEWNRAADVFNEAMKAEGICWFRRTVMTAAVKLNPHPRFKTGVSPQ